MHGNVLATLMLEQEPVDDTDEDENWAPDDTDTD